MSEFNDKFYEDPFTAPVEDTTEFGSDLFDAENDESVKTESNEENSEKEIVVNAPMPIKEPTSQVEGATNYEQRRIHQQKVTAQQIEAQSLSVLLNAMKQNRVAHGVITSVRSNQNQVSWLIQQPGCLVEIPISESFLSLPDVFKGNTTRKIALRAVQFLSRSIGADIPFIVKDISIDPNGLTVFRASRCEAMRRIQTRFFGPTASDPVAENTDVTANIVSLGTSAIYVSCCGLDLRIGRESLTHAYIERVSDKFRINDAIRVRIQKIIQPSNNEPPKMAVSARECEMDLMRPRLKQVNISDRMIGTVTSVRTINSPEGQKASILLYFASIGLAGFSNSLNLRLQDIIQRGDEVLFEVNGITDAGYLHGSIIRIQNSK